MSPPTEPPNPSSSPVSLGSLRLRVQDRLHLAFHHELRGRLNGAGLQLSLLERLGRGDLSARPELVAKAGDWVAAARSELEALQSWGEAWLSLSAPESSSEEAADLGVLLAEAEPWLEAQGRRSGTPVELDYPKDLSLSVPGSPDPLRWALLDLATACVAAAASSDEARIVLVAESPDLRLALSPWPEDLFVEDPTAEILAARNGSWETAEGELRIHLPLSGSPHHA